MRNGPSQDMLSRMRRTQRKRRVKKSWLGITQRTNAEAGSRIRQTKEIITRYVKRRPATQNGGGKPTQPAHKNSSWTFERRHARYCRKERPFLLTTNKTLYVAVTMILCIHLLSLLDLDASNHVHLPLLFATSFADLVKA